MLRETGLRYDFNHSKIEEKLANNVSTLDLRSGYHCIPVWEADKDKTAFITRRGC